MNVQQLSKKLKSNKKLKNLILDSHISFYELSITVAEDDLKATLIILRDGESYLFRILIDICGVDYPKKEKRFTVVYQLLSIEHNLRIKVKVEVSSDNFVPTVKDIFSSAHWYEREIWDMYGIFFVGNDDLRIILTDYGFSGFPMRKDFPLTGNVEVRYDSEKQKVVYEPVKLAQEFRDFDFKSPWEGEDYILPGDEKATKQ
ncbi:MAG: NADH-quinone oxidoreductase subunit C [Candidatus Midichloriaceae bacterium]